MRVRAVFAVAPLAVAGSAAPAPAASLPAPSEFLGITVGADRTAGVD